MDIGIFDCDLFQIRLFLTVAKEQSFSRAAEMMHVEQSTLSRRIALLEQNLGFPLFRRESRPIQLTAEGKILFDQWQTIVAHFEHSLEMASVSYGRNQKKLTVCSMDSCVLFYEMPKISSLMREIEPDLTIAFEYVSIGQWKQRLADRLTDVVLTVEFSVNPQDTRFCFEVITTTPKLACVLKSSPLSHHGIITFEDLKNLKFITIDSSETPDHENFIRRKCRDHGFEPEFGRRASNALGLPSSLQANDEVLICDKYLRGYNNPLFKIFELPDTYSNFYVVWLNGSQNPHIRLFINKLREVAFHQDYAKSE